ncbi:hypothetical protein C1T17_02470 [Sphingobium sp. SCG-1]|uniref:acyl-CoA dehydrogenase n=1 Tax=Sphingobium sp. SCG-1 TaxID=2072936 RepID=UPI000CD6A7A6|nr:acyl-CoA dehydrogenase [Sphingobium sp. SCG-1]AUW57117.1 hypothetical protein C1T17_02470 [Sphingobium sp. SCG-1]
MIDLLTIADEQEIADTIARKLAETYPVSRFRVPAHDRPTADDTVLSTLAEMGTLGLGVPETAGGLGLGCAIEALAFREYGRFLVSPAILGTIMAARIAAAAGDETRAGDLVSGRTRVGVGIAAIGEGGRLDGDVQLFELGPERLFVLWNEAGAGLYNIDALACRVVKGLDETLTMEVAANSKLDPLLWVDASSEPLPLFASLFSASLMVGMGEAARDMAVEYAKTREQYGKPIGHFQAVAHKCADMALHLEAAWCETIYAALDMQEGGAGAPFHVLNAKILAAKALLAAAKENIQIHGGMGYTTEVPAHHFMKRGHVLSEIGGSARQVRTRLLDLPFVS